MFITIIILILIDVPWVRLEPVGLIFEAPASWIPKTTYRKNEDERYAISLLHIIF
jgi:hypothetical protein